MYQVYLRDTIKIIDFATMILEFLFVGRFTVCFASYVFLYSNHTTEGE